MPRAHLYPVWVTNSSEILFFFALHTCKSHDTFHRHLQINYCLPDILVTFLSAADSTFVDRCARL